MWTNEPRTLPDWIEDAYEILAPEIEDGEGGLSQEQAHDRLLTHDTFPSEPADAEYAVERLLDSGWFYEVDGSLRVTDPDP
jgi:hypothetical protein